MCLRDLQSDLDSVLSLILRESAGLVNCARCSLFVLDESGTTLTARVYDERQDEVCLWFHWDGHVTG